VKFYESSGEFRFHKAPRKPGSALSQCNPERPEFIFKTMRKLIQTCLLLTVLLALSTTARAQSVYQGFGYMITNSTVIITNYTGTGGAVTMPATINGLPVVGIGAYAFAGNTNLTSLAIGTSVASIGAFAFDASTRLTSVTIPGSLLSIGGSAFADCAGLTNVLIPNSVTSLGSDAFAYSGLTSISIPGGVTSIQGSTFYNCASLTTVTIAGSVTNVSIFAFANCNSLTNVLFLGNSPGAGAYAFGFALSGPLTVGYLPGTSGWGATFDLAPAVMLNPPSPAGLLQVTISPAAVLTNGAEWQVDGGVLQVSGATVLGLAVGNHTVSFTPVSGWAAPVNQTISVSANATATASGVYTVPIPSPFTYTTNNNGTITIAGYTGSGGAVTIPGTVGYFPVISIGDYAFQGAGVTSVTIPNSVTNIGNEAFANCDSLTSLIIPNSVIGLGVEAFASCGSLASVTLSTNLPSIPASAFAYCSSLTSITIPASVTSIGTQAFGYCSALAVVTLPNTVVSIGDDAFEWDISLASVALPGGLTSVGNGVFADCSRLATVTISSGVRSIGGNAFASDSSLAGIIIPNTVTSIGAYAFSYCSSLASVTLGTGVTSIGDFAFAGDAMAGVTLPASVTSLGEGPFSGDFNLAAFTVNAGNSAFASVSGVLFNHSQTTLIAYPSAKGGTSYIIPNSVTSIRDWAFEDSGLVSVTIPNSVTSIGNAAFNQCASLGSVILPNSVTSLGDAAFDLCASLTNLTIGSGITNIGNNVFEGTGLISVTIPNNVISIGGSAFFGCASLTTITNGSGVVSLGGQAFASCANLAGIYFPGNAPSADATVFAGDNNALAYYEYGASGWTSTFGGIPTVELNIPTGSLRVTLTPAGAITAGAQWQVDGGVYESSGLMVTNLVAGSHTVSFKTITGWTTPANQMVSIIINTTTTASGAYVGLPGALQVTISPAAVVSAGAQWSLNGGAYQASGAIIANLPATNGIVSFKPVTGWTVPTNYTATILNGLTNIYAATYQDAVKPVLTLGTPKTGQIVSNAVFTVTGTATDNWQVTNVFYSLNNGGWSNAVIAGTNWSAQVTLAAGTNTIQAYATDPAGDASVVVSNKVDYVVTASLTVLTNQPGWGVINPNDNGASLIIGTAYTLTATAATGFQFVNWTNNFGMVSNTPALTFKMQANLALTANFADTQKPLLTITAPTAGQRATNPVCTVTGVASDNAAVAGVSLQLNSGNWFSATGTNSWSASVNLAPGTNSIKAFATDTSGNVSATNSVVFDFVVTNQLGVQFNGLGTLTPNDSNVWLEVGRNYSLTAAPATCFVFTNWTVSTNWLGGTVTNKPVVQFMMASNLTLTANFAETTKPVVTITNLAANQKVLYEPLIIKGTTSDNWLVSNVWCELGGGGWVAAGTTNGYKNWAVTNLSLVAGTNTVRVYAQNFGGLYSTTNSVSVVVTNAPSAPMMSVTNERLTASGLAFSLQITGGASGVIQGSTNLSDWETVTNFAGTNTTINFYDPTAVNYRQRYYRAMAP